MKSAAGLVRVLKDGKHEIDKIKQRPELDEVQIAAQKIADMSERFEYFVKARGLTEVSLKAREVACRRGHTLSLVMCFFFMITPLMLAAYGFSGIAFIALSVMFLISAFGFFMSAVKNAIDIKTLVTRRMCKLSDVETLELFCPVR